MQIQNQKIIEKYLPLFDKFKDAGYKLYIVGGAVRDMLQGMTPKDFDFSTDATPDQIRELFADKVNPLSDNSSQFGTIFIYYQGETIEITTFRRDISRGRHPKTVYTTQLEVDARRRDFIINCLYLTKNGIIIDPTGRGIKDVESKILRTVGNPKDRLMEDPLRFIRAIRFWNYGFKPVQDLERILVNSLYNQLITEVSIERITDEFLKSLAVSPRGTIRLLQGCDMLKYIIPEFSQTINFDQQVEKYHDFTLDNHLIETATYLKYEGADSILILIGLLHDIAKPITKTFKSDGNASYIGHDKIGSDVIRLIFKRLKMSKKQIRRATVLVRHHMRLHNEHTTRNLLKTAHIMQLKGINPKDLTMLYEADLYASKGKTVKIELPKPPILPIDGWDIMALVDEHMDTPDHSLIGKTLDYVWEWLYKSPDLDREEILDRCKNIITDQYN